MGFAENVLNKVRGTPVFKPASVDSFGNWAIEAGDVITVENDGVTEHIPIFSSDMSWNGSAQTTMSCTGNQKREIQDKQTRKDNVMSSGLSSYTDEKLEELGDEFGVQIGGVKSALDVYVKNTEEYKESVAKLFAEINEEDENIRSELELHAESIDGLQTATASLITRVSGAETALEMQSQSIGDLQEATASLSTRVSGAETALDMQSRSIGDLQTASASLAARAGEAEAKISLNAQNISGVSSSVATLQADVIYLKGLTQVGGSLNVYGGNIYSSHDIEALTGTVVAKTIAASQDFLIDGVEYAPTQITSTSGTVRVLGIA